MRNESLLLILHFVGLDTVKSNLMYVCPCIIYENEERHQLDATILLIIVNNSTCFGHPYAHLQEYKWYTTAYGQILQCIICMYLHIYSVRNTTINRWYHYVIYITVQYTTTCFGLINGPSSGCW